MGDENPIRTLGDYSKPSHEHCATRREQRARSITTWEDLTTRFLAQFFPLGRKVKLRNDILMFQQHHGESLSEAWTRFKDLLQKVPHHGIDLWLQLEDPRDFAKPVKAIALPQDVLSTSDRYLIELENQVQRLMEAHLAPTQPTQLNKITASCEICSGPHETQYYMEDLEQSFVEYLSLRTDKARGLVSKFMASQDARLTKFEADFKQQQSKMTNKINTVLKAITDRIAGSLPSNTVKNLKLSISPVLSARSYPTMDPQFSTYVHASINAVTIHSEKQGDSYDEKAKENEEEEKDSPKISIEGEPKEEGTTTTEGVGAEYFNIFPTKSELAYHKYLMCSPIPTIFLRNPIIMEGCPSNLKIPCNIGHVHVEKAYIDLNSPLNIMTQMMYNWIMRRKLDPRENSNRGVRNFTGRIKGIPRLSQVVLGKPFVKISNMTHDPLEGAVRFINGTDEVGYKMHHMIEQYNSLSDLEKEHTKSVYRRNEKDKRRGVEFIMSKILGFYKECLELGPEYVTGMDDEGEVTLGRMTSSLATRLVIFDEKNLKFLRKFHCTIPRSHFKAALRGLRYLKGSPGCGIQFNKRSDLKLIAFAYADWANYLDSNPVFHDRTKHFELDVYFVSEKELEVNALALSDRHPTYNETPSDQSAVIFPSRILNTAYSISWIRPNLLHVNMDNPNITMKEYIGLEEEKAPRCGKVFNWKTATYGKIWDNEDVHDLGSVETEFPAIVFNGTLTSEAALSCEPTVSPLNDNKIDFRISFDESDDEDYTNEFSAIVYNTKPTVSPQHIDEFDLKDETSLSECDEKEQNVLYFNDLFPLNVIYPNDSKSDKDNDDDKVDIEHSSGDLSVIPLPSVINVDTQGSNKLLETSHDTSDKIFKTKTFIKELNVNIMACNYLNKGMPFIFLIKNLKDAVEPVDNELESFLALKPLGVGYGTNSLLEQWRETYGNADYEYDPYDDDMYEGPEIPNNIQSICDKLDIKVQGHKEK
nr:MAK10-like protein [Tanacetum cinerariifolium]